MSGFQGYVCWEEDALHSVLTTVAARPSDAVFLATHRESPLRRSSTYQNIHWEPYSERDLLRDFQDSGSERTIVAVLGESGTGKSHLVRWLDTHIERAPGRRVVSIPKHKTNLRDVLLLILDGLEGESFEAFRKQVRQATQNLTVEHARLSLLTNLEALILGMSDVEDMPLAGGATLDREVVSYLRTNLPALLTDQVFRSQLNRDGSVIDKMVCEAIRGREDDKAQAFEIQPDDMKLDGRNTSKAGRDVQRFAGMLNPGSPLLRHSVALLNHFLPQALRLLYNLGGNDLEHLMREVRAELKRQGQELILLIEDFAQLQGIQMPLLEAIIDDDTDHELCPIRVALAVTTGYFQGLNTVHTRLAFIVTLDIDAKEVTPNNRNAFLAAYLNAAREGNQSLEKNLQALRDGRRLASACSRCPFCDSCHPVFGATSVDGVDGPVGLYPLNFDFANILEQKVEPERINPRELIRGLGEVLREAQDGLPDSNFPTKRLMDHYSDEIKGNLLSNTVMRMLDGLGLGKPRVEAAIKLWGTRPPSLDGLPAGIQIAFQLPMFSALRVVALPIVPPKPPDGFDRVNPEPIPVVIPIPSKRDDGPEELQALSRWSNNNSLTQPEIRDLRKLVFGIINHEINWEVERLDPKLLSDNAVWREGYIDFEGAINEGLDARGAVRLALPVSGQSKASVAAALEAYEVLQQTEAWPLEDPDAPWLWREHVRAWTDTVLRQLRTHDRGGDVDDPTGAWVEFLYWGAVARGQLMAGVDGAAALEAMFAEPKTIDGPGVPLQWARVRKLSMERHPDVLQQLLGRVGIGKSGGIRAIDAAAVLPHVNRAAQAPTPVANPPALDRSGLDVKTRGTLFRLLPGALTEVEDAARDTLAKIRDVVGDDVARWPEVAGEVRAALFAASGVGILGAFSPPDNLPDLPVAAVLEACENYTAAKSDGVRTGLAGAFPFMDAAKVSMQVAAIEAAMAQTEVRATRELELRGAMSGEPLNMFDEINKQLRLAQTALQAVAAPVDGQGAA